MRKLKMIISLIVVVICTTVIDVSATPQLEIDKYSCGFFYRPDNTYSLNYRLSIYNNSTNGEVISAIQINDNLINTFGSSSRIISAYVRGQWGDSGDTLDYLDLDWTNMTNWNGTTVTNIFNNGNSNLSDIKLYPGGYIQVELCVFLKADDLPIGIGSGNSYTNTANFVSATVNGNTPLSSSNLNNTNSYSQSTTLTPERNRSIFTVGTLIVDEEPPPTLDGLFDVTYYVKVKQHPQLTATPNPDGPTGIANSVSLRMSLWDFNYYNIPIVSTSHTLIYGPPGFSAVSGWNGYSTVVGGVATTPSYELASGTSFPVGDSALIKIDLTVGPTSVEDWSWQRSTAVIYDPVNTYIYQNMGSNSDTLSDPFNLCVCWSPRVRFVSKKDIEVTKVADPQCVPNVSNRMDVDYTMTITAPATNEVWLNKLSLKDSLNLPSCGSFMSIVTAPTITSSTATSAPSINSSFNGTTNAEIFNGNTTNRLLPGESIVVEFTARYNSSLLCTPSHYNKAYVGGYSPGDSLRRGVDSALINAINCLIPCELTIQNITVGPCDPYDNKYDLTITLAYDYQPTGNILVDGLNFPQTTSPQTININDIDADGAIGAVLNAYFTNETSCTDNENYNAPDDCKYDCPPVSAGTSQIIINTGP